ncbi:glycosyltransferase family A protein [Neptunicella marina]|uniref:Glycosyltransferase family 2 protein n=1 Tax=Neptunicella marina TaxID=2125989 RepID=A0A8J6IZL4_9ALTE|nr:glycosyltransferase family A protein [Neptunicella marina]MBC3767642.1 glycosyltransferase family 2 protein [Neptunicella marina]
MYKVFPSHQPKLSFCIPVKNRLSDIQATLRQNLEDNRPDQADIEFIVICFDDINLTDGQTEQHLQRWIELNFADDLRCGYLRFYHLNNLPNWHFGKAKNAFKPYIKGKIYASLDGDNFTGKRGGRHIIDVFEQHQYQCVLHQFQGGYGDGTCGRIALNKEHYLQNGYDDDFLPRQWDELDAILTTLVHQPQVTFIHYPGAQRDILQRSYPIRRFLKEHNLKVKQKVIAEPGLFSSDASNKQPVAAVGQHDSDYVSQDQYLRLASIYNHHLSLIKNASVTRLKNRYQQELLDCLERMLATLEPAKLANWFLTSAITPIRVGQNESSHATSLSANTLLFAPLHTGLLDNQQFQRWYQYHSSLGVEQFYLLAEPQLPIHRLDLSHCPNVQILTPAASLPCASDQQQRYLLEIMLKAYGNGKQCYLLTDNSWVPMDISKLQLSALSNIYPANNIKRANMNLPIHRANNPACEYLQTGKSSQVAPSNRLVAKLRHFWQRYRNAFARSNQNKVTPMPLFNARDSLLLNWQSDMQLAYKHGRMWVNAKRQSYPYVRFHGQTQ